MHEYFSLEVREAISKKYSELAGGGYHSLPKRALSIDDVFKIVQAAFDARVEKHDG